MTCPCLGEGVAGFIRTDSMHSCLFAVALRIKPGHQTTTACSPATGSFDVNTVQYVYNTSYILYDSRLAIDHISSGTL